MTAALPLRLGTRGSELALWRAERIAGRVRDELGLDCRIDVIRTQGDRVQDLPMHQMEGKGFFTCAERVLPDDDRLKYDSLFHPGDRENKLFWTQALQSAGTLVDSFLLVED